MQNHFFIFQDIWQILLQFLSENQRINHKWLIENQKAAEALVWSVEVPHVLNGYRYLFVQDFFEGLNVIYKLEIVSKSLGRLIVDWETWFLQSWVVYFVLEGFLRFLQSVVGVLSQIFG